jgi:acyl-CoA synthetase (NDP forming)
MTEMFDIVQLLSHQPLPSGRRVAVIAEAPGPGSLTAGALEANGLEVPPLLTVADEEMPNPVLAPADQHQELVDRISGSRTADAIVVVDIHSVGADAGIDTTSTTGLPVLTVRMGDTPSASSTPVYGYPEPAARALAAAIRYAEWKQRPEGEVPEFPDVDRPEAMALVRRALGRVGDQGGTMSAEEVDELLELYRIPTSGPDGGTAGAVSMREDPVFGPLIVFRMSGRLAELAGDQAFRINPLRDRDADEMIGEVRSAALIGEGPGRQALADLILRVSFLVENIPEITEINLDPVTVDDNGVHVGKATASIKPLAGAFSPSRKDVPGRMLF